MDKMHHSSVVVIELGLKRRQDGGSTAAEVRLCPGSQEVWSLINQSQCLKLTSLGL